MQTLIVEDKFKNTRLDKYLFSNLKGKSFPFIIKLINKGNILVNNLKVSPNYKLKSNDTITIDIIEKEKKNNNNIDIKVVYEDEDILIVDKPSGLASHEDWQNKDDSMLTRVRKYLKNNQYIPQLNNRLDKLTSGLMIFSKNQKTHTFINKMIEERKIEKYYKCTVHGIMPKKEEILNDFLNIQPDKVVVNNKKITKDYLPISIKYKVLDTNSNSSSLEVELLTGRKHQIRAQLAYHGHPILGDKKYGIRDNDKFSLTAFKIIFNFDWKQRIFSI